MALWFQRPAWQQILIALVLGIITGLIAGPHAVALQPIGTIFIHAIQMLVVPVVFTAIICAVLAIDEAGSMRRATLKAIFLYIFSMIVAALLGLVVAWLLQPGVGVHLAAETSRLTVQAPQSFADVLVGFVPSNPIQAFVSGNVVQILVMALLFGFAIKLAGERAEPVAHFFKAFSVVVFKFAEIIVRFAPYGIFALIATVFGQYGIALLLPLAKFVATVYIGCFALIVLFYAGLLACNRINPWHFIRAISQAIAFAFTTSSSAATLPITFRCVEDNLKVSKKLSGFLLPLGTSFNLNGLSIYLGVATVFAANIFGVSLHMAQYFTIVITIVITAIGAAAVPGSALIVMSAVMSAVGIPLGALSLIAGVDRFNDMAQTATNVIGDCFAAVLVAKSEGMIGEGVSSPISVDNCVGNTRDIDPI